MSCKISRERLIRIAGIIAVVGNGALAILKLVIGSKANSLALIGDGIDSSCDVAIAILTIIIGAIIAMPSDKEHPWGHGRAETTASMALAFIIFFAGFELASSSIQSLKDFINGSVGANAISGFAIVASIISIVGKILLAISQFYFGKKAQSTILLSNAENMKNDIFISSSVLVGIALSTLCKMPVLDSVVAFLVALWVIKNAITLFLEMNTELMDGTKNESVYEELFEAIKTVKGATRPHRVRIRKIASLWDIDLDIEVDAMMSVHEAHDIAENVADAIRARISSVYDIMVHVEPAGHQDHHPEEQYGLSENDLAKK